MALMLELVEVFGPEITSNPDMDGPRKLIPWALSVYVKAKVSPTATKGFAVPEN